MNYLRPSNGAVLLNKDGTLVRNVAFNVNTSLVHLAPNATSALLALQAAGYRLGVVTDQPGIAGGMLTEAGLVRMALFVRELLLISGIEIECFHYCPHDPTGSVPPYSVECECRKPRPGLITRALATLDADPEDSWMISTAVEDMEGGARAGCRTVLIDSNATRDADDSQFGSPTVVTSDLLAAARAILTARALLA